MSYLGSWKVGDLLTFCANTHAASTGAATNADAAPVFRVFEDEGSASLASGSMAALASANTTGFYSEQLTLSSATGYEKGKSYSIYISAAVSSVTGTMHHNFQIEAEVDANSVSDKTGYTASVSVGGIASAAFIAGAINNAATSAGLISSATFAAGAINAPAIATDAIGSAQLAAAAISSAKFAAGAITSATLATDSISSVAIAANAIGSSELASAAIAAIQAGLATSAGIATLATSANLATALTRLGTPSDLGSGATVAGNLVDIEAQTDDIGAAGAGLTALVSSATGAALATSASIAALNNLSSAQVATALNNYDAPTKAELDTAVATLASSATLAAVKLKTDSLTFTIPGQVDANAESMNATTINGTGASGDLWRGA